MLLGHLRQRYTACRSDISQVTHLSDLWGILGSAQGPAKTAEMILALLCVVWPEQEQSGSHGKDKQEAQQECLSVVRGAGGTAHAEGSSPKKLLHALQLFSLLGTTARAEKD